MNFLFIEVNLKRFGLFCGDKDYVKIIIFIRLIKEQKYMSTRELSDIEKEIIDVTKKRIGILHSFYAKILFSFLSIIANRERMRKALFESDEISGKSLYRIRNEIAHGSISERDFEIVESMRHRLFDARNISREIIIETINKAERLEKYMM